ncbi:hypothetical protein [Lacipirellula parvula]|uniref:Carboxypeptidase regulatory-like domain-containing protein n=1 Tax=Lacipirellula parvula TaxID=2650471 RepID=A0A5K7XAU1_9BACT|nr:hypothetical protein [Lacipirellula parvula]BBO33087.1 hypothetical protein PLANPX_2699 [Lacipirellula parvula]
MMPLRTAWHCVQLGIVAILLIGCGGKPSQVSGTVTLDGKAIERGMVGFTPANGGMRASGVIESDGTYSLTTNRDSGLEPGEYMVTVVSREPGPPATTGPPAPGPYITPQHYAAEATSGLKFTVERGSNKIDLALTTAGAPAASGRK